MNEHTPGPWAVKELHANYSGFVVVKGYGEYRSRIDDKSGAFSEADARLIAAAPELLEALTALVESIEDSVDVEDGSDGPAPNWAMQLVNEHGDRVNAAIKKARGES